MDMRCLGIESTAHTFGASIVDDKGDVLSNVKSSYTTKKGGMLPSAVADHHVEVCDKIIAEAIGEHDFDLIAFSQSPGLGHALRIGAMAARSLAISRGKPLIGVNHCIAHLEIGYMLFEAKDPILMYASGANTQIIAYEGRRFRIFGETLDIGIGNFLDSVARVMGLGFPGGPKIQELAANGHKYIELPYVVKGMDVSFGGLLTNIKNKVGKYRDEDLAYSIQETVFAMLTEVTERAIAHCGKDELILGGGVACNNRLQEMAKQMCEDRKVRCLIPENQYLVDNAAMIAWLGILMHKSGITTSSEIRPYERTDDVEVTWR